MLPAQHRLRKKKDFQTLFRHGRSFGSRLLILKIHPNNLKVTRCAFIVSNRVTKKAVERNKLKRQLRHIIALKLAIIVPSFDAVLVARTQALNQPMHVLANEINFLLHKARLFIRR